LALAILALGVAVFPYCANAQYGSEKGSIGGSIGVPFFITDPNMSSGQEPRIILKYHFGYVITDKWRLSTRGGFGWVGYDQTLAPFPLPECCGTFDLTKVDQLSTVNPFTFTMNYTHILSDSWMLFAGAGPGIYRINILNDRKTIWDPVTFERFTWWSPGISLEGGGEFFFPANRNVSLEFMSTYNWIFSSDYDRYPSGYNGDHSYIDFDFGVNVYFGLGSPKVEGVFGDEDNADTGSPLDEETEETEETEEIEETSESTSP
jgi:hypothetical protein